MGAGKQHRARQPLYPQRTRHKSMHLQSFRYKTGPIVKKTIFHDDPTCRRRTFKQRMFPSISWSSYAYSNGTLTTTIYIKNTSNIFHQYSKPVIPVNIEVFFFIWICHRNLDVADASLYERPIAYSSEEKPICSQTYF